MILQLEFMHNLCNCWSKEIIFFSRSNCIIWFPILFIEDKLILLLVILHYRPNWWNTLNLISLLDNSPNYLVGCVIQKRTLLGPRKSSSTAVEGRAKDNGTDSIVSLMVLMNRYKGKMSIMCVVPRMPIYIPPIPLYRPRQCPYLSQGPWSRVRCPRGRRPWWWWSSWWPSSPSWSPAPSPR